MMSGSTYFFGIQPAIIYRIDVNKAFEKPIDRQTENQQAALSAVVIGHHKSQNYCSKLTPPQRYSANVA